MVSDLFISVSSPPVLVTALQQSRQNNNLLILPPSLRRSFFLNELTSASIVSSSPRLSGCLIQLRVGSLVQPGLFVCLQIQRRSLPLEGAEQRSAGVRQVPAQGGKLCLWHSQGALFLKHSITHQDPAAVRG